MCLHVQQKLALYKVFTRHKKRPYKAMKCLHARKNLINIKQVLCVDQDWLKFDKIIKEIVHPKNETL